MCAWICMKRCVSTDVGTWTNWLTFEPDPDYSPDAGTGLLSPISYVLQRGILLHLKNPTYKYWAPIAAARRGFKMVVFTASHGNTFVGGKCDLPSAHLVLHLVTRHVNFTNAKQSTNELHCAPVAQTSVKIKFPTEVIQDSNPNT